MAQPTGAGRSKSRAKLYAAIDELYTDIYSDGEATAGSSATSTVNAGISVPVLDEAGSTIGYLAVYANAGLTA